MDPIEPFTIQEFQTVVSGDSEFSTWVGRHFPFHIFLLFIPYSIDFTLRNADVTNQHNMCFTFFDFSIVGLIIRFNMNVPTLNIRGTHSTSAQLSGIANPVVGNGNVNINANNVEVSATTQMRTLPNGNLTVTHLVANNRVQTVQAQLTGFGLLDGTISRLISAAAPGMVADNQDKINDAIQAALVPGLNRFLNGQNINSLVNLLASRAQNPPPRSCFGPNPRVCPPL
jgi:hypothetical protein